VFLDTEQDPFVQLFSESAGRVLVAVPRTEELRFTEMCTARGLPWCKTGVVDPESGTLELQGITEFTLDELREAWESTLPALFD
jgi:phosphoribosylformylglycinamidine synthase